MVSPDARCLLPTLAALLLACPSTPKPPTAALPAGPDAASANALPSQPAPEPDPDIARAERLHEPCEAARKGVETADAAVAATPRLAPAHFRLGEWLRFRAATCFGDTSPARNAESAAAAFATAHRLDPSRAEYVIAWAFEDPSAEPAARALAELLEREPGDPAARFWKARRPETTPDEAIALLSRPGERCVAGQFALLGDLRAAKARFAEALAAYLREIGSGCEEIGPTWQGERLARIASARLGAARAALESKDALEARRQLSWLRFEAVDAALPTVDAEVEEGLWRRLRALEPKVAPAASSSSAEAAVAAMEAALLRGDLAAARALWAGTPALEQAFASPCDSYQSEAALRSLCILRELLPEAPKVEACEGSTCRVTGRPGSAPRTVSFARAGKAWRIAASER